MNRLTPLLEVSLILLCMVTAFTDIRSRRIPNWAVVAGLFAGFAGNTYTSGWMGMKSAALGFLCAFAVYLPLYLLQGRGAGDLKLMAAIGAIIGIPNWFIMLIITSILGGIVAVGFLLMRGGLWRALGNSVFILKELLFLRSPSTGRPELSIDNAKALTMPHGVVVALSAFLFLWLTHLPKY